MIVYATFKSVNFENPYEMNLFKSMDGAIAYLKAEGFVSSNGQFKAQRLELSHIKVWISERSVAP